MMTRAVIATAVPAITTTLSTHFTTEAKVPVGAGTPLEVWVVVIACPPPRRSA